MLNTFKNNIFSGEVMAGALVLCLGSHGTAFAQPIQKEELRQITQPAGGMAVNAASVTIYGLIDTSIAYASSPDGRVVKVDSGHMNGSRVGFKGSEDLGGGLRANFLLEAGINSDLGTSGQNQGAGAKFFGRGALLGLSGSWGEVRLGRIGTAISSEVQAVGDAFGLGGAGNLQGMQPAVGRDNNTVWYQSPKMAGAIVKVSHSFSERSAANGSNKKGGQHTAASLFYVRDGLSAAVSYTTMRQLTDNSHLRWLNSSVAYDFGRFKTFASFATFKNPGQAVNADVHAALDSNLQLAGLPSVGYYSGQDDRSVSLGVAVPWGASTVLAQAVQVDDRGPLNRDATQWAVAYLYAMSKRTTLYVDYGKVINRNGAGYNLNGATSAAGLSTKGNSDVLHLGVRHAF